MDTGEGSRETRTRNAKDIPVNLEGCGHTMG